MRLVYVGADPVPVLGSTKSQDKGGRGDPAPTRLALLSEGQKRRRSQFGERNRTVILATAISMEWTDDEGPQT